MLQKPIIAYGKSLTLACDGRCDKAWGINCRSKIQLSDDPDDYVFDSDEELDVAPANPGTYEGGYGKPSSTPLDDASRMNKWCFRECERSVTFEAHESIVLPDLKNPLPNKRDRSK